MNKLLIHIVVLSLSMQSLQTVGTFISFKLNQDFIAKVLCVNKDKPEKGCNGKCHLKKQLKKQTEENKQSAATVEFREIILISQNFKKSKTHFIPESKINVGLFCIREPKRGFHSNIFHPPKAL